MFASVNGLEYSLIVAGMTGASPETSTKSILNRKKPTEMSTMLIIAIGYRINEYLAQFLTRMGHWAMLNHHALTYSFIQSVSLTLETKPKTITTKKCMSHMCAEWIIFRCHWKPNVSHLVIK